MKNLAWCRTPLDRFVLAKLEAKGISPNAPADRRKLIRRAYFDLIGLPPTPEEVEAFVTDQSRRRLRAADRRLLASRTTASAGAGTGSTWPGSPRATASSTTTTGRPPITTAISSSRRSTRTCPTTRSSSWQIAGDEFEPDNPLALMATGFPRPPACTATQITANQVEKERYDELDDMAATVGTAMLGLTIGCARCHDHKFDPIPQADYYRLLSTFTTTVRSEVELDFDPEVYREAKAAFDREHAPLAAALARFEAEELPARSRCMAGQGFQAG